MFAALGTPALPWCEFRDLLTHLPREAAYWRSIGGDTAQLAAWSVEAELLVDLMHQNRVFAWANADPKKRGQRPPPPDTPWTKHATERQVLDALADFRARHPPEEVHHGD